MIRIFRLFFCVFLLFILFPQLLNAQTNVVVTFDNPAPPGAPDSFLNGVFQGIDFGTSQWRWAGPYGADPTNNVYFASSSGTSRSFSFSPAPRILTSINVYTTANGTMTLSDGVNPVITRAVTTGSMQLVTTGWTLGSTTVTVGYTAGWSLGIDDITHSNVGPPDTTPPTVSLSSPAAGTVLSGTINVTADAFDQNGVAGVRFFLDGVALGAEDTIAPYVVSWNTATASNGPHTLTAVARDGAGNQTTSTPVDISVDNAPGSGAGFALRFFGNGVNDIDRVKIQIDDPANGLPGPPADVGAADFTLEFWMKASAGENNEPAVACGNNNNWIFGNIIFDRDRYNQDRSYGLSLAGGRLVFGVSGAGTGSFTVCGTTNVLDDAWHHVAIQRRRTDGWMWIYVDGILEAQANGPDGDISYPDNGIPGNFCGPGGNQPCTNSDPYLVIGAEKHDAGPQFPSYSGLLDEVRLSNTLRYSSNFTPPVQPFVPEANTVALYHFDEGQGDLITDSSGATGGPSHGIRRFGGSPAGPQWVSETPFELTGPALVGQWEGPFNWPIVAVHMALLSTGEVLLWDRDNGGGPSARLWNPTNGAFTSVPNTFTDLFCAGHTLLADGRHFIVGGNAGAFIGLPDANIFHPQSRTWTLVAPMAYRRWYPTAVTLSDGRVLVASGSIDCATCIADIPEIYNPGTNTWTQLPGARLDMPLYPFLFVLPDGRVLNPGSDEDPMITRVLDLQTQTWTVVDPALLEGGSAVMFLPGQVMKSGSASDVDRPSAPAVASTYVLDMAQPLPRWRQTEPMAFPRGHHTLTILPDGSVLVTGGGRTTDGVNTDLAVYEAELWSPETESWTTMAAMQRPRLYHSTALLLPDGRVLSAGGGRFVGFPQIDQPNAEIYSPPYLFKGPRPVITTAPGTIQYGTTFFVATAAAANIAQVTLLAPGSVTHSVNMHQRFLSLDFQQATGGLDVQLPANVNLAPPGDYMLFLIDTNGVPSVARFVSLVSQVNPLPTTTGTTPTSATRGGAGFTLTVNGTNFVVGSTVRWNGADRPTTWSSSTQLTATIAAADIALAGTAQVTVFTPAPGGGTSNAQPFTVNNPLPATSGLLPNVASVGGTNFTLTVTGSNFVTTSVVRWNDADRATTYSSPTQLTATILASDIATAGSAQVTVYTPAPGGGTSNAQTFTITATSNPVPATSSVTPSTAIAGGAGFTVTVTGSGFVSSSVVRWNGADRATTYSSPTQLTATILASDIATAGSAQVTVYTPAPGGGTSNAQTFTITAPNNPVPATSSVTPSTAIAGGAGFTVTVTGSGFVSSSVVRWNGADRATTYGSATQLTATILASDIATAGSAQVTVYTPAPGGGTSNAQTFTITNAVSGLVAAYSFNAGSGTTVADASGNGNTGTITGATWTTAGRFGSALSFNGSSNMVTVNDANSLDLTTGMTLTAWVYPTVAPSGWRTIVAKERSGGVVYFLHAGSTSNNRPATGVYISNAERQLFGGSRLSANTWTHLAATYDGTTQRLYVNGVQVSSRAQTGTIQTSTNPLRIGGNSPYGEFFQGRIDEVHIYNRALTQAEIQAVMNTPLTP